MAVDLASFISRAKTADIDHQFVLDAKDNLATAKPGAKAQQAAPDLAAQAFVKAVKQGITAVGGDDQTARDLLANIGIEVGASFEVGKGIKLTVGHVQALRIELSHLAMHGGHVDQESANPNHVELVPLTDHNLSNDKLGLGPLKKGFGVYAKLARIDPEEIQKLHDYAEERKNSISHPNIDQSSDPTIITSTVKMKQEQ